MELFSVLKKSCHLQKVDEPGNYIKRIKLITERQTLGFHSFVYRFLYYLYIGTVFMFWGPMKLKLLFWQLNAMCKLDLPRSFQAFKEARKQKCIYYLLLWVNIDLDNKLAGRCAESVHALLMFH